MTTKAAYVGSTFSLLGALVGAGTCVWSLVSGLPAIMAVASGGLAAIMGYVVVRFDWPEVWRPLLTGK